MCCCMIQSHRKATSTPNRQIAINRAADKIEDSICLLGDADNLLSEYLTPLEYCSVHIGAATRQAIIGLDALDEIRHPSRTED